MNWFRKLFNILFNEKESLRDKCVNIYGEEFGEMYDSVSRGEPVGGFVATAKFIQMVEAVKQNKIYEQSDEYPKITGIFVLGQNGEPNINIKFDN